MVLPYTELLSNLNTNVNNSFSKSNESSMYDIDRIILLRPTFIRALRDFITVNVKILNDDNLASIIKNNTYFHDNVIEIIINNCGNNKIIDSLGIQFIDLMGIIFFYIENLDRHKQKIIYNTKLLKIKCITKKLIL